MNVQYKSPNLLNFSYLIIAFFILVRSFNFSYHILRHGIGVEPDSGTYLSSHHYFDIDFIFNTNRGIGITVPYNLIYNPIIIVIAQFTLVTILISLLILKVYKLTKSNISLLFSIPIFFIFTAPQSSVWDTYLLSHSLTLIYNLIIILTLLNLFNQSSRRAIILNIVLLNIALVGTATTRPNNQIFALVILIYLLILILFFPFLKSFNTFKNKILVSILFIFSVTTIIVSNSIINKNWSPPMPIPAVSYLIVDINPISYNVIQAMKLDTEIPTCAYPKTPLKVDEGQTLWMKNLITQCPDGVEWYKHKYDRWLALFYITHPKSILYQIEYGLIQSLTLPNAYDSGFITLQPVTLYQIFFSAPDTAQRGSVYFNLIGFILMSYLAYGYYFYLIVRFKKRNFDDSLRYNLIIFGGQSSMILSFVIGMLYHSTTDNFRVFIDNQVTILTFISLSLTFVIYEMFSKIKENSKSILD